MISRATSSFQSVHHQGLQMFPDAEDFVSPSVESGSGTSHSSSLLFNLSILKDKLSEVQTLVGVILSPNQSLPESTSMAISSMNSTIQEIVVTATSMMFTCQQMALTAPPGTNNNTNKLHHHQNKSLPHSSNIDFDYKEYGRQRFQQYWIRKPTLLDSPSIVSLDETVNGLLPSFT